MWLYFNSLPQILRPVNLRLVMGWEELVRNGIHLQIHLSTDGEQARELRVLACHCKFQALSSFLDLSTSKVLMTVE